MPKSDSEQHPLKRLFAEIAENAFVQKLRWSDFHVVEYVAALLYDFTHVDHLYRIRDHRGKRLNEVAEMLLEADLLLNAGSFEREREVHRHIGDFTLFMVGIFPEFLKRIKLDRWIHSPDFLIDYVKVGKYSYRNVSEFTYGDFGQNAPLFRKLSENFEICVVGLGYIKKALDHLQNTEFRRAERILLN